MIVTLNSNKADLQPGSIELVWGAYSLSDDRRGNLIGNGGRGSVNYATGVFTVNALAPFANGDTVLFSGTQKLQSSELITASIAATPDADGIVTLTLPFIPVVGSVRVNNFLIYAPNEGRIAPDYAADYLPKMYFSDPNSGVMQISDAGNGAWQDAYSGGAFSGTPTRRPITGSINYETNAQSVPVACTAIIDTRVSVALTYYPTFENYLQTVESWDSVSSKWVTYQVSAIKPTGGYLTSPNLVWKLDREASFIVSGYITNDLTVISNQTLTVSGVPVPAWYSVSPATIQADTPAVITLSGINLSGITAVKIGGIDCTNVAATDSKVTALSALLAFSGSSAVTVTAPVAVTGAANIMVMPGYVQPFASVTSISPTIVQNVATAITVTGFNLSTITGVSIGGVACTSVVATDTRITASVTIPTSGNAAVTFTPDSVIGANSVTVVAAPVVYPPTIASVTPNSGFTTGGTVVMIEGTYLAGAAVTIGGIACTVLNTGYSYVQAVAPVLTVGAKAAVVATADGATTLAGGFTVSAAPSVIPTTPIIVQSITPNHGVKTGGTSVILSGSNLDSATITLGGISCTVTASNYSSLTFTTPNQTVGYKTLIAAKGDITETRLNGFLSEDPLPAPTVTDIIPASGLMTGGQSVGLVGTGLENNARVTIGGIGCAVISALGTSLYCMAPNQTQGIKNVVVTTDGGTVTVTGGYTATLPAVADPLFPVVTSFVPDNALMAGGAVVVAFGSNLLGSTVTIGGVSCTIRDSGADFVDFIAPATTAGAKDVIITNSAGPSAFANAFTVKEPVSSVIERVITLTSGFTISPTGLLTLDTDTVIQHKGRDVTARLKPGSAIVASYSSANTNYIDKTVTATLSTLQFKLEWEKGELVADSFVATLGGKEYYDIDGKIVYGLDKKTGTGTESGTIDTATRTVTLTSWDASVNTLTVKGRAELIPGTPSSHITFRTPAAPVAVGSFSFRAALFGIDTVLECVANSSGVITGSVADPRFQGGTTYGYGKFDYQTGVASVYFGIWVTAAGKESEPWYRVEAVRTDGKVLWPRAVNLESLTYNCVTYSNLPLNANVIGLDPVRLPSDGQVPIFRDGQIVLVHHTAVSVQPSLSPTQVIDCERTRLYRATIEGANGVRLSPEYYTVNRELGTITMKPTLDLTGLTSPYTVSHTIADISAIADADLSGRLVLTKALSHTFPEDESRVSGVLYAGTLQARYTHLFVQSTWTSVWSDTLIGSEPLAQYNDVLYPIQVTNAGVYPDRILIQFTSSTAFRVIGENLGLIGTGDITQDCSPTNPMTSQAYFTMDYRGWGSGWATGNCVRFNLIGANYPVDLIRAIQPSTPTGVDDSVELLFIGNTDAI